MQLQYMYSDVIIYSYNRRSSNINLEDLSNIVEDENSSNPEENSEHFIAIIIECLALLNKIPEAVEVRGTR